MYVRACCVWSGVYLCAHVCVHLCMCVVCVHTCVCALHPCPGQTAGWSSLCRERKPAATVGEAPAGRNRTNTEARSRSPTWRVVHAASGTMFADMGRMQGGGLGRKLFVTGF